MSVLNFTESPNDSRDYTVNIEIPNENFMLETKVDWSNFASSVKNQGKIGSCSAHACVALAELFYNKNKNRNVTDLFSEKFTYYVARVNIAGWSADRDSGCFIRDCMKGSQKYGLAEEKLFSYDENFKQTPNSEVYENAKNFQITKYAKVPTDRVNKCLFDLRYLLQNGHCFIGGFKCYDNIYSANNGNIPLPQGVSIGGHSVLFVGYDDYKETFKFKNSWGTEWGDNGYGYLPYDYVLKGLLTDIWIIYEQEDNNEVFTINNPVKTQQNRESLLTNILSSFASSKSLFDIENGIDQSSESLSVKRELYTFAKRLNVCIEQTKNNLYKI